MRTGIKMNNNDQGVKHRNEGKFARIPIKVIPNELNLIKPEWIKVKIPVNNNFDKVKNILRQNDLKSVCEEASCPNIVECFGKGTATFMIMGDICTRRCTFCDVAHGRPNKLDENEPEKLANAIKLLQLKYVVITSVDRDDLRDGGATHFTECIKEIRKHSPNTKIEILVPDFRGRLEKALDIISLNPPDVINHNLETVARLYKAVRPGSDYNNSLNLLKLFKEMCPDIPTKSGIMVGLGETDAEIEDILIDMRRNNIDMLTIGQYLQPSKFHSPVLRYVEPSRFKEFEQFAYKIGFKHAAVGALVRSSYHADEQVNTLI